MPYTDCQHQLPFSGALPQTRHNSYRAAVAQRSTRGVKKIRMLAYIRQHGRVTDHGLAEGLSLPIQSVCSLRHALCAEGLLEREGDCIGRYGHRVTIWRPTCAESMAIRWGGE